MRSLYGFWIITLGFLREVEAFYSDILNNEVIRSIFRGYSKRETPGSIPNPEAKTLRADGTALLWVWESRSPRVFYSRGEDLIGLPLFLFTQKLLE